MKQLNARKCSAVKHRIGSHSQRPLSPSSIHSGYSLYSTDTEDPVMSTHRGLDRCAALLANMMQTEEIEDVPTKLERGVGSKMRGVSHANQQKQTSKQRGPVTKTKVRTSSSTQRGPVQTGTSRDKKQTGRRSFNQKLVSSTPKQKLTKLNKGEKKKHGGGKKNSKDGKRDRTEFHQEKDHLDPTIPARVSPGNKENQPLSIQPPQRGNVQHQFIETYDVTPEVLNENVITRTRVKPDVIKNPALRQHHVQTERLVAARSNEKPHCNAASSKASNAMQRLNEQQTYAGERDHAMLQPQSVDVSRKAHLLTTLPQDVIVQPGNITGIGNHSDPYTQPWVSPVDLDPERLISENQRSRGGRNAYHQQHQHYDHHQQQQEQLDYQTSENRGYTAESHLAASSREGFRTAPGSQPSRSLDPHLQSGVIEGPTSGGMGPVQTTQSILRDLVGKLQKMNESQSQAPQAQHIHPSPSSGITPQDISHTQLQIGHGSKNASSRGVEFDVRDQGGKLQDTMWQRNLPKHSEVHHTTGSRDHETGLGASVRNQNMDLQCGDEQLEPVRDSGRSCDQQSTNQSPGSVITQMQRMSHEDAGMDNENSGNCKPQSSPGGQKTKDDVGVQTPPLTSRPPTVTTSTKGSNALWDQVRALRYITSELHSANRKKADVQTEELLTELEEVIETLPFTSLDRDLQTEISLALQPIRSENSQLRRRLRIANQQLRQFQLQAQAKEINQSDVSLEVLTLQSLNVNLQKQVEELQSEKERQTWETADLRASLDQLSADKHNMQDIFKKMDADIKEKRKSWTLETSTLRQEITKLKSQLESDRLRLESVEKEKEILKLSVKQRDSEIKRLQQMTRSMQEIISSVVPEKSLQSSLPNESKESRLENWLENHQSTIDTPSSLNRNDILGSHHQTAWGRGQRSPDDTISSSSSPSSTREGHSISVLHRTDWERMLSDRLGSVKEHHAINGGREEHKHTEDILDADGRCDDLDSTLIGDTLDGDGTAYMSFADPQIGSRKPYSFHTSHKLSPGAGGTSSWVEKELSPATVSQRHHLEGQKTAHVSDELGRTANGVHEVSSYHGRTDSELRRSREQGRVCHGRTYSELRRSGEQGRVSDRDLGRIFNATEVGSVVSESTISSIASQYEAQFQVGLSKLDEDIARLQENLKGIVKR